MASSLILWDAGLWFMSATCLSNGYLWDIRFKKAHFVEVIDINIGRTDQSRERQTESHVQYSLDY